MLLDHVGNPGLADNSPLHDMRCVRPACIEALWEDSDLSYLRQFDEATAARTSFIAAFPLKHVRSGLRVGVEHHFREVSGHRILRFFGYGRIGEQDIRQWR